MTVLYGNPFSLEFPLGDSIFVKIPCVRCRRAMKTDYIPAISVVSQTELSWCIHSRAGELLLPFTPNSREISATANESVLQCPETRFSQRLPSHFQNTFSVLRLSAKPLQSSLSVLRTQLATSAAPSLPPRPRPAPGRGRVAPVPGRLVGSISASRDSISRPRQALGRP